MSLHPPGARPARGLSAFGAMPSAEARRRFDGILSFDGLIIPMKTEPYPLRKDGIRLRSDNLAPAYSAGFTAACARYSAGVAPIMSLKAFENLLPLS